MNQTSKVFVGSLPTGTKPEELRRIFEIFGSVVECDVMNRCGFIHMENSEMAEKAIAELNGSDFKGYNIVVEIGRPKDSKRAISGGMPPFNRPRIGNTSRSLDDEDVNEMEGSIRPNRYSRGGFSMRGGTRGGSAPEGRGYIRGGRGMGGVRGMGFNGPDRRNFGNGGPERGNSRGGPFRGAQSARGNFGGAASDRYSERPHIERNQYNGSDEFIDYAGSSQNRNNFGEPQNFGNGDRIVKFVRSNNFGPVRKNFKFDRNVPYQRSSDNNSGNNRYRDDADDGSPRRAKYSPHNYSNDGSGSFQGRNNNESSNWNNLNSQRGYFPRGFSGNMVSGRGGGNYNNNGHYGNRDTGGGQDRRGFALPSGGPQDHINGSIQRGFTDSIAVGGGIGEERKVSFVRNNDGIPPNSSRGGRGGGRGGTYSRGGGASKRGNGLNTNNYLNDFPPLGNDVHSIAPHQNMMSNRRF